MISTTIAVTSMNNPSTYGSLVGFEATITPGGSGPYPTMGGTLTFYSGGVRIGSSSVTWNSTTHVGTGGLGISTLLAGSAEITASYSGDSNYSSSTSSALTQTVDKYTPTTITLSNEPSSSVFGQSVAFAGTVDGPSGTGLLSPSGTMDFYDSSTLIGSATVEPAPLSVNAGVGFFDYSGLSVGSHTLLGVTYSGDNNYNGASSTHGSLTVSKADSWSA